MFSRLLVLAYFHFEKFECIFGQTVCKLKLLKDPNKRPETNCLETLAIISEDETGIFDELQHE